MELYLSNCYKAAEAAATKAAASSLAADREQCATGSHKKTIPEVGAANLLDLPLGVKLPVIPGSNNIFYTTNISEKLYQPSYDFNLTDPYCRLLETSYKSLHDPHLKTYYKRKDILRRLKKDGYITSNNKVICTLKELNKYRQYLTTLKLDFERNYIKQQKMIEKQVNKLYETKRACDSYENTQFQGWLLQESRQATPDQELVIKHRYLDMISRELDKVEHTAEKQSALRMKEEELRHQDHIRRKLSLRRQIEEEWKMKEMLLLTKIGEEVKREARIEEQRQKVREEAHRKKQALLEKKIAHHLQKMQRDDLKREGPEGSISENKGQDEREAPSPEIKKTSDSTSGQKLHQGQKRPGHRSQSFVKVPTKKPSVFLSSQHDVQKNKAEQKKDKEMTKTSHILNEGIKSSSLQAPNVSAKTNGPRHSVQAILKPEMKYADFNEKRAKKSSFNSETAQGVFASHDSSIKQQNYQNCCQEKVTSEELNSIIHNIMIWVVAAVTSILYPAITKYEERLQNIVYPLPDDSTLSSNSVSCCSTFSEMLLYEASKAFQAEVCEDTADRSVQQPAAPISPPSAHKERTVTGKTHHRKRQCKTSGPKNNETAGSPKIKTCKSDSHLSAPIETGTKESEDATTKTDGLEHPLSTDEKAKVVKEMQELKNVFDNFKHHLKEETELILENIFHEMVSELTQTIPILSSVMAKTLDDQTDIDKGDLISSASISSAAAEIMESMLDKLQSVVEKKCIEVFSQENFSVHFKSDLPISGEHFISPEEKTSKAPLSYTVENMSDIAEDMVHVILEKLMALASSKQNELARLEITTELAYQQHREDPIYVSLQRACKRKSSAEPDAASLNGREEIQNIVSNIFSQSSLVGYIQEAISTILNYIRIGLNESLIASKETVVILQLLDDILAQLHQKPAKTVVQKRRHPGLSSPSGTEEEHRLTSTRVANDPRYGCLFPPINVPGMLLYSEDENKEIDKIVENVLISSIKDEKAKLQEQLPDHWLTRKNGDLKYKRNMNLPTKPASQGKLVFPDWGLKTDLPAFDNRDLLKDKPCLNKDHLLLGQHVKHQIQKASENIITSILAEILKDISSGPSGHLDYKNDKEASLLTSESPQDLSSQDWMNQMFSVSEIQIIAQEVVDAVLKILYIAYSHIIHHSSSVDETSLGNADIPNNEPLEIWFESKRKMKFLFLLGIDPTKDLWLEPEESRSTPEPIVHISDKIIYTIFKKLKSFICPKLQNCFKLESYADHSKPVPDRKPSFQSHFGTYTTKVVKIVLDAIQKELKYNKKNENFGKSGSPKHFIDTGVFADYEKELDSVVTRLNNDIMINSLATCICELLSGNTGKSNVILPSDELRSKISHETADIGQQCHCPHMQEKVDKCTRLQVLDRIGDTLYDMLHELIGDHPFSPPSDEQNREQINENLRTTTSLQSNIQLISHTILEDIIRKLCSVEMDHIYTNSECIATSEYIDTDSLSFALLLEEMSRCSDIISSMMSSVIQPGSEEVTNNKGKTTASKTGTTKVKHTDKLEAMASEIFEMVFAKLKWFANRNLETLGTTVSGNKKNNKRYWESESINICTNTHERQLQSALYVHAKKVSSTILKAMQTELNVSLPDLETDMTKPLQEKEVLKNLVNLILDAGHPNKFNETEPEDQGIENYRYRPTCGNFLPGGADPESYLEDLADIEKESPREERPPEETKSESLKQWDLERTFKNFEVELKEPEKSPVVPIIRNILNEIFQDDLIDQLSVLTLSQSHVLDTPHAGGKPFAQKSIPSVDKRMDLLVSEADVTVVVGNVVRTILQKLSSAAMTDRNANENKYNTITCLANISFPEHASGEKSSVHSTTLDRNPGTFQSTFGSSKRTKINVVEDIIQSVLTNLEMFATSKVKALFCPHINLTVPMALPLQQDEIALSQPWLSTKHSYSDDQCSSCSGDHNKSGETTSICHLTACKLNRYATEVARQILQGIKQKLDKEMENPFLAHNIVVSDRIPSQTVNTVLSITSTKGKYEKNIFDRAIDLSRPEDIIERLFNKSDYRKKLQLQILDTIEGILSDICEKALDENNVLLAESTLNKCNISGKHLDANSETIPKCANKAVPVLLVPKSSVAMISSDMVDIVLQTLTSAIMLGVNAKDSIFPKLPLTFSGVFPEAEHQQPLVMDPMNEREREILPFARRGRDVQLKSIYCDDNQTTIFKRQDAKKYAFDPCEENARFITKTILNRLKSFATERIDFLLTLYTQTREKPYVVGPEFTNYKQNYSVFLEANQTPSDVNIPKVSTARTILGQEVTDYTFANYREKHRPAIHISQGSLREYADIIASTILMLIKNDIDLEIQKMYSYPNNTSFQENIIASETVYNIFKSLCDKISLKANRFYSQQNPNLFTQLAVQNEILPGQRKMEDNSELSLFSKYPHQNQILSEAENLRRVLEEIFKNGESRQEKTALLSVIKEMLKKIYQRIMEDIDHCPPFKEAPHFTSGSKIKTSTAAQKKTLQSHISSVANDIVESVFRKMFSIVTTSLYENKETKGELEASGNDELLMNPSYFQDLKQAERSVPPEHVTLQVCPSTGFRGMASSENTLLQTSPLQVGKELVQKVLKKITNFVLQNLENNLSPKDWSDETQSLRPCSSKASFKGSPNTTFKTHSKAKSKVIVLPKFGTKPHLGPSGAKAKSKTKLSPRVKTFRGSQFNTGIGLPYLLSTGDAKNSLVRRKLPTAELKMYAKDIVSNILETIMNEFQKMRQNRLMVNINTLTSDQILTASKLVNAVLQGLYATKNKNLVNQTKGSYSHDLKLSQMNFRPISLSHPEARFSLENVSSQLEKVFPKEDILKQMFGKWQTESNDIENDKYKLFMIAETVLNEISMKTKELEQSVSFLNLSPLEACESRYHNFKSTAFRAEGFQAQINIFGQEIVKKLFEKLEVYFMTQMFITDGEEMLESKKETSARNQGSSLRTNILNSVPTYSTKLKDKIFGVSSHQIAQEIMEGVLNILESFADLQFKHITTYAFSEIVKIPIENFFAVQQKPLMKTILPKLQQLNKFPVESKSSSMISQENMQNSLRQLHSFHSELLTYTANIVNDMLDIIKNNLDKEKCQMEPSSSQIISTLMDQCTHFYESIIKSHPKENLLQVAENANTANCHRFATGMGMYTSKSKGVSCGDDLPQIPGLYFYSEEDRKVKDKTSANLPSYIRYSAGDTPKTRKPLEGLKSELKPLYSRGKAHGLIHFDQALKGNSSFPEGSVLQKPSEKSGDSGQAAPEHSTSFIEMEEGENQRVHHCEFPKPIVKLNQIQKTISSTKICVAAENIVNTMLLSCSLSGQTPQTKESIEIMKPLFVSREKPLSLMSGEQKDNKSLLKIWEKRISSKTKEENKSLVASGDDFTLLEKWKDKYQKLEKIAPLEEAEVIAFADQELGPHEIHLVARYVTIAVVTHFKNFEARGSLDEKVSIVSTPIRKKYESKQPLKNINYDSSLYKFCEHLTELVISYIISSISDCTEDGGTKQKSLENQDAAFSKVILVHSQVFASQPIFIRGLALSISEIIIQILFHSDIIKADTTQQVVSMKTKYIYCPRVAVADFDDLFQDLLMGVIHVLSKEIGIKHQSDSRGRNKLLSRLKSHSLPICNKTKTMKRQTGPKSCQSVPTHRINQLAQKNKLNPLACKLGTLVGSLKTHESKEVVSEIFNIVFNLFLPDECPNWDMDSGKISRKMFLSSNNQQSLRIPRNNAGLSPKSAFLLNVVCEKFIRILLEKCTAQNFLTDRPSSDEISVEGQLFNILQNVDDYCRGTMDSGSPFEEYDMSDLLENLAEINQESMLSITSHILVKSLMEKLSCGIHRLPRSPLFTSKNLMYSTRERLPRFPKGKRPELKESRQGKRSVRFMSYDSKPLTEPLNNPRVIHSKTQALFGKQFSGKFPPLPPLQRPGKRKVNATAILNMQHPEGMNTGVFSATFLEEIIADIFLNLSTSLQGKNVNIAEAQLNDINILYVNSVVNEFNNAQVTVLRDVEERICFPPIDKETVRKIVDSVYSDVSWEYTLQVTSGNHLTHATTSIAEQITNGILKESMDYQLPLCFVGKIMLISYYPLKAENILQKLQNNLREFNYQGQHSMGYTTMLSHSFLEHVIRKLLFQLISPPCEASCLGKKYLMTLDFNEISTCIINKVLLVISKHRIWLTKYDCQHLYTEKHLQNMVDSVYNNVLLISDSLVSIQKSIVSHSPVMLDQMASLIIQEIIDNHLQPFLCGESLPCSVTPLDEISNMVKEVLSEVMEPHRPQKPSSLSMDFYPNAFVEDIVARLLSKFFNPKYNTECELNKMTQKVVNLINNHFNKANICILRDDQEQSVPTIDTDTVDELVNSVYENVLKQHGLAPEVDNEELKSSDIFAENVTNLIVSAISDYLFHPLFSGDLSASSYATLTAENIIQNIFSDSSETTKPSQHRSPYNTLLPYTFLEDIIRVLLSRIFPSTSNMVPYSETPKGGLGINCSEISSKLISDIKMKIAQHEIRFSKDEETESIYSEDDAQHLIDSVFRNILQNSGSKEAVEHDITSSNNVLIDRIAGFIIKDICQQHLHPFVYGKSLLPPSYTHFDDMRKQNFFARVYSSAFLEDVISGVLSKIFQRVLGIVQINSIRDSGKELLEIAEKLIYLIMEEFSKAQVGILKNAREQLCLPPVHRDVVIEIIDMAYSKVLQEYELEPDKGFLDDTKTLAERVTKIILAEVFDFQIHPDFIAKLPFKSYSRLNADVLIKRVHYAISKSRLRRQTYTTYTTILSHTHLEKIVTQVLSQLSPLNCNAEDPDFSQSDFSNTFVRLIGETMSIISKHAICIIKHGNEKQNVISEKDIQAMVEAIYTDISHSSLYQSITKDKEGMNNIPIRKIASYIIKEIFTHHLESFLPGDKTLPLGTVGQTYQQRATDPKQRELLFIVNSAVFLEDVISELLCRILYIFSHNVLVAENLCKAKANITNIVTTLVKSIVLEFTTTEILVADHLDENLYFSEGYKEIVKKTVSLIYKKILDDHKSLIHIYRAIQSDAVSFGKKICYLLVGEIYDYQVESLVLGELAASSYSSLRDENIIRNVLDTINNDSHVLPSCFTVFPRSLLEDISYKLLARIFLSSETETELNEKEVPPDHEFVNAASKLTDEIITEISEHEIRLATAEEHVESMQLRANENFIDSICNNIMKKIKLGDETQSDSCKKGNSFLKRIAGFIMKEIVDHHLQPFLHEESPPCDLPTNDHIIELLELDKENKQSFPQASVYSATFLEDVIIELVRKFYTLPSIAENPKDKEISEKDLMSMAIKFANALIGEFRKSKIKVLANAGEMFSFPPIAKEAINKVSDSVYNEVIETCGSNNVQKDDGSNIVIEIIASLAKKAISAYKIQLLFSGDWSSTFFSFLNVDNIIQRVQHLPYNTFTKINKSLKENPVSSLKQLSTLTPLTSGLKDVMDTLEIGRGTLHEKGNFKKKDTSMKTGRIHEPICTTITSIMKGELTTLASELVGCVANKKKGNKKKKESSVGKDNEKASKVTSPTTNVESEDTQGPDLSMVLTKNEIKKKDRSGIKDEKQRGDEMYQHLSSATDGTKTKKVLLEPDLKIDKKKSDKKREGALEKEARPSELPFVKSKVRNREIQEKRRDSPAYRFTDDKQILHLKHVQNVTESIYRNVLEISSFQGPVDNSKSSNPLRDKAAYVTQADGKDFSQPALKNSAKQNVPAKEKENEKTKDTDIKSKLSKPDSPPENNPRFFPANFLEDVICEIVKKLIFNSSPGIDAACQNVTNNANQAELYDTAMKLIDSLLKEFSDAQIKVLSPDQVGQFLPSSDKVSSVHNVPLRQKEPSADKAPPEKKTAPATKTPSSDEAPSMANTPSSDKMLVSKIVHSSICNILQEYRSQDSIYKDINSNGENLVRKLANAVIEEILQHQLHLLLYDEVPAAACLPLESKQVMKKVHKVVQTACKECQTSSPYTIMLPYEFLESIISSLLSKIFSTVSNAKTGISEDNLYAEVDFLQMKLVSTIMAEISKDKDMIVQYVESLHPNDDEIIQLVVQTIYNNLLPQFGSQEGIQNCVGSGCKILSETIVNLVVQEVAGNQLQNYFSGELTPHQCIEVDNVVENILKNVIQTTEFPQPQPSWAYKLPFNIIEEIAVNFLSKLLSMFPKADKKQNNSLNAEMQSIISKILNSFQEYLSKSQIIVVPQAKESPTVSLADSTTIEKVANSVYNSVLRCSGSHISVYKDLRGKSNVLADIIGFLMVKEISNSEFHPQVEEETSSSELVLEAVKIMEKVVKIIDDLKLKKKLSTKKDTVVDARFLEETLALFLAKLINLPSASSKNAKKLSNSEVNKIASYLTKSVTAEISKNNISVVATNPEETFLNPESIEIISQMINSIYNHVLQQSGTHEQLYYDMKGTNNAFFKEVASLIISKVSNCPLEIISPQDSQADLFGDLDVGRIVEKVHEHAVKRGPELDQKELNKDLSKEELPIKIIPHCGKQPINIDPDIVAEHLGVISIKTQSLERLQMECLTRTGHSIEALRRVAISGRSHSVNTPDAGKGKKERRVSLDEGGRLNIKPLETASRNSFQNLIKPDITKVELLKDVHGKKDLIIRLVTHDIDPRVSENIVEESLTSDEDEVVLQEVVKEQLPENPFEDQVKEDMKPITSTVAFTKPLMNKRNLKKFLSLGKCCHPKSTATSTNTEASPTQQIESEETQQRTVSKPVVTTSKSSTGTDSSFWERKTQLSGEEMKSSTEPVHYFLHRIMSSSSYNEEDLPSFSSGDDDRPSDPSAIVSEESLEHPDLERASTIKFITLYQRESGLESLYSSNDGVSDADKPSTSKQGSEIVKKVSSVLSKVFSRSNANVSRSSAPSPPHQD